MEIQLESLRARMNEQLISLEVEPEAIRHIAKTAYDPAYGARPVKRYIQRHMETAIGRKIIAGEVSEGSRVIVSVNDDELEFGVETAQSNSTPEATSHAA